MEARSAGEPVLDYRTEDMSRQMDWLTPRAAPAALAVTVLAFVVLVVLTPRAADAYKQFGAPVPWPTSWLVAGSDWLRAGGTFRLCAASLALASATAGVL